MLYWQTMSKYRQFLIAAADLGKFSIHLLHDWFSCSRTVHNSLAKCNNFVLKISRCKCRRFTICCLQQTANRLLIVTVIVLSYGYVVCLLIKIATEFTADCNEMLDRLSSEVKGKEKVIVLKFDWNSIWNGLWERDERINFSNAAQQMANKMHL